MFIYLHFCTEQFFYILDITCTGVVFAICICRFSALVLNRDDNFCSVQCILKYFCSDCDVFHSLRNVFVMIKAVMVLCFDELP